MNHSIHTRKQDLILVKKDNSFMIGNTTHPAKHRVKLKQSEKLKNYLDFPRKN